MDINDIDRRVKSNRLSIPMFHRAHISLMPESEYTVIYLRKKSQWTKGDFQDSAMDQILITPHPFDDWDHIWMMTCTMNERPGVVRDVLTVLKKFRVNVLSQTSRAVHSNKYHQIDVILSTRQSGDVKNTIQRIQETIIANFLLEIRLKFDGSPELNISQLMQYKYLKERFLQITTHCERYRETLAVKKAERKRNIFIEIPKIWFEELLKVTDSNRNDGLRYIMHTNTKGQLLSVYFPHSSRPLVSGRINHRDEVGAISAFTTEFGNLGINLISTLTRKKHQQINQFEFICEKENLNEAGTIDEIKNALSTSQCLVYEPRLSVPDYVNFRWSIWEEIWNWEETGADIFELRKSLQLNPLNVTEVDAENREKTERILQHLERNLLSEHDPETYRQIEQRIQILKNLLRHGAMAQPTVFVSHKIKNTYEENFENMYLLIERIKSVLEKNEFDTVIGIGDAQGIDLTDVIRSRMDNCHFYLGVLTQDTEIGSPSDWVIWEYGYGSKQCLHSRLMKEKNTNLSSVIVAPANEFVFSDLSTSEGQQKIDDLIQVYASEFKKIWHSRISSAPIED